jgi:hypothetical protein
MTVIRVVNGWLFRRTIGAERMMVRTLRLFQPKCRRAA